MKYFHSSERGMTLIELLAAIVIGAIIMIFVTSILTQNLNEQKRQTTNQVQQTEMRYALKQITKDMRKSTKFENNQFLSINEKAISTYVFNEKKQALYRDGVKIASNIKSFKLNKTDSGIIDIKIEPTNGKWIDTQLYFRSGSK